MSASIYPSLSRRLPDEMTMTASRQEIWAGVDFYALVLPAHLTVTSLSEATYQDSGGSRLEMGWE